MPAVLSDKTVCVSEVPFQWHSVLEKLTRFLDLQHHLSDDQPSAQDLLEIHKLHDQLLVASRELCEPSALDDLTEVDIHRCFTKAVFALMHTARAVLGEDAVLDTTNNHALALYEPDFGAKPNCDRMIAALRKTVYLSEEEIEAIRNQVDQESREAERKHAVIRAIRDHFDLWEGTDLRQNVFGFFEALYPNTGLIEQEVELVVTGSMIFFCLPIQKDTLTTPRFRSLAGIEKEKVTKFLKRLKRFQQWQFAHFPVFGYLKGSDLSPDLLLSLAERAKISVEELTEEISSLCAIVPLAEVDKYVVHDIWGHSWQACLLSFDHHYRTLATYAGRLSLDETAIFAEESMSFGDCFKITDGFVTFDEGQFRQFVDFEVAERLPTAMVPVFAEILADVAEFKLVATNKLNKLDGSSRFDKMPAKLDLTLQDVEFYFRQATKVFRLWAGRKDRQSKTVHQLIELGAEPTSAEQAVQQAVAHWCDLENEWMAPNLAYKLSNAGTETTLNVNVFCRLCLNFLSVHSAIVDTYRKVDQLETEMLPMEGFRDLLIIAAAVFLEAAPARNLWRIDEFLSIEIVPLCVRLAQQSNS